VRVLGEEVNPSSVAKATAPGEAVFDWVGRVVELRRLRTDPCLPLNRLDTDDGRGNEAKVGYSPGLRVPRVISATTGR
jgi:hypothetical protein